MHNVQLRLTDTNSATDSDGSVWGIDAALVGIVLCAAFVSIAVSLALWVKTSLSPTSTTSLGAVPLIVAVAYVRFKQSHPPGYDIDLIESWLWGNALGPADQQPDTDELESPLDPALIPADSAMSNTVAQLGSQ